MTGFPFTVDERGLAHVDEATLVLTSEEIRHLAFFERSVCAREIFEQQGTPISQHAARRLAFVDWLVYTKRLGDWPHG